MKDDSIPGSTGFWVAFTLIAWLVWVVASAWNRDEQLEALRAELNAPRPETAAEASAADAAERLADIAVKPGLWRYEQERAGIRVVFDLLLREGGTFVATATAWAGDREKFAVSAEGSWRVKGHTIIFSVKTGAQGFFPTSGRAAVRRASGDELVIAEEGNRETVLTHRDVLAREAATLEREGAARAAEREVFAALPLKAVPAERFGEWLFEQEIFLKSATGIVLAALLFAGWSFVRRGGRY